MQQRIAVKDCPPGISPTPSRYAHVEWSRTPDSADSWVSEGSSSHRNLYGTDCDEPFAWCSERQLGSDMKLSVRPGRADSCEASTYRNSGQPDECSDGTWQLTIHIGPSRQATCGF